MRLRITIDGDRFSTMEGFYEEMERLLTRNLDWKPGHSLDGFHDLLRGGFGLPLGEGIDFFWLRAEKSRRDLGYEQTAAHWERLLKSCHPSNREALEKKRDACLLGQGETLFDLILVEIEDKTDGYDHTVALDAADF